MHLALLHSMATVIVCGYSTSALRGLLLLLLVRCFRWLCGEEGAVLMTGESGTISMTATPFTLHFLIISTRYIPFGHRLLHHVQGSLSVYVHRYNVMLCRE
jgi:hypothetical protein